MDRLWTWAQIGLLALLWGSTFLWIELALEVLAPVQVTLVRCVLGSATLLLACAAVGRRLPRDPATWGHVFVAALFCNALPFAMFSVGQQSIHSGVAGVLNATTPLWSLLIGITIGLERGPRPGRMLGLLLGFAGVMLIFAPWQPNMPIGRGALPVVAAAVSYAIGFAYMSRHLVGTGIPTISLSAAQLTAATGLTALTLPFGGLAPVQLDLRAIAVLAILGTVATGATFHLTYRIIAAEGATNAAAVGYLLPVVSVGLGAILLGEELSARIVLGMTVVLAGVALTRRRTTATPPARNLDGGPVSDTVNTPLMIHHTSRKAEDPRP
ncbi:DMT family transporter [Nocardioides sp. NPDC057767]|uniref:DMT family transporter n=1 Tax=unclassified Nocardioides TaxID=2615069 RepID=UPI00366F69CE